MGSLPWVAMLLAAGPTLSTPESHRDSLVERLQLTAPKLPAPAPCPDLSRPVDDEAGLACAASQAQAARAVWQAARLQALRTERVGFMPAYQSLERPELPPERTLWPFAGFKLRLDLVAPH